MSLTTSQITNLNNSMSAAQDVALGTQLNAVLYGGLATPTVGTLENAPVLKYSVAPAAGSATATKAAIPLTASAQTGITAGITQPDYPRIVTVKGNASGITGNVVVYGRNINDESITDTIALNGATEVLGTLAFKTVSSIDYPAEVHAGTDTVSIGRGNKIGFPVAIPNASQVVAKTFDGSADAGTVTAAATVGASIYAVAGTMNGTKVVSLFFMI